MFIFGTYYLSGYTFMLAGFKRERDDAAYLLKGFGVDFGFEGALEPVLVIAFDFLDLLAAIAPNIASLFYFCSILLECLRGGNKSRVFRFV